ncbi:MULTISPECIES: hypothetical protein [Corallococcus]|uniref:hypothetical protein n=1 Tax=Corallococcus TaxID=83461 RepID=UPI00137806C2|nr:MULTISPECIES: hypothetical protein [Corallococcus]NBD10562.1 hypothetical protein [Corallococcus silvisoli]
MRNLWKVGALSAVFGAVLGVGGCQDFDAAYEDCKSEGRCEPRPDGGTDDGGSDAGDGGDGGDIVDPEPTCTFVSDADEPDPEGRDLNCDGVDGVAAAGYFVDPVRGSDTNEGTQLLPLLTLNRALEMIRTTGASTGRTHVYLGVGTYNEPETVVTTPVSLHGGYKWNGPGDRYWSRFKSTAPTLVDGGTLAFTVRDVTDPGVLLDSLHIVSSDGLDGGASIAVRALDSSRFVLRNTVLEAGKGGQGQAGSLGANGQAGLDGPGGSTGGENTGGGGGRPLVAITCADGTSIGGAGGTGNPGGAGLPGAEGSPGLTPGGAGGYRKDAGCEVATCSCEGSAGDAGFTGSPGEMGNPGDAGAGSGIVKTGQWEPNQQGTNGTPGKLGAGGGGGGAGGSCNAPTSKIAGGSGGGGGGTGGCGGSGGKAGAGGGASIALLLSHADVTLANGTRLSTRGGGEGGAGGPGGLGGDGGIGGNGGPYTDNVQGTDSQLPTRKVNTVGGQGGMGGVGGPGGRGGWGGGGGGGPSVGVWCEDAGVTWNPSTVSIDPGLGGAGGHSDGGVDGAQGLKSRDLGCTFTEAVTP